MKLNVENYSELKSWKAAMDLVRPVYSATEDFPKDEIEGLRMHIRNAVVSIAPAIARGYTMASLDDMRGKFDLLDAISISLGELTALDSYLLLSHELELISLPDRADLLQRTARLRGMLERMRHQVEKWTPKFPGEE